MWLLASLGSWGLFALGLVILLFILFKRLHRHYRRKPQRVSAEIASVKKNASSVQPRSESPLVDAPRQILRWQVEMHETARDLKAELDSKMMALQALVQLAREETSRLENAISRARRVEADCSTESAALEAVLDFGHPLSEIATSNETLPGTRQQRRAAFILADQGRTAQAIANEVGATLGEVEMMLGTRGGDE